MKLTFDDVAYLMLLAKVDGDNFRKAGQMPEAENLDRIYEKLEVLLGETIEQSLSKNAGTDPEQN